MFSFDVLSEDKNTSLSLWVFDSDVQDILMLLVPLLARNMIFFYFKFL